MNRVLVSVIILNFNTRNYLEQCLRAVTESKGFNAGELEVVVVDNGSTDASQEMIKKFRIQNSEFRIVLIENEENLGFAAGNNVGIRKAKGKYILLLNSDTTVYSDTLIKMVRFGESLPKLGAATCRIELPDGKIDPACHRGFPTPGNALAYITGLEKLFPKSKLFGGYHQGWQDYFVPHEVNVISGAFFFIPGKVVDKVGLLDESFFMYGEDIDWCYRIKQAGFEIWFNPEVKIIHYKKQSGRDKREEGRGKREEGNIRQKAEYHFVYTMEQFYKKHYVSRYPKFVNWLVFLAINFWKRI